MLKTVMSLLPRLTLLFQYDRKSHLFSCMTGWIIQQAFPSLRNTLTNSISVPTGLSKKQELSDFFLRLAMGHPFIGLVLSFVSPYD